MYHPDDKIGPYTLVKRLGQGSFGVVWLARDSSSIVRDHVALKLPVGDEIDSEKMRQEAVLWLRASGHPNVLPVIDARIYQDQVAIVTEYVAGGTLGQRLDQNSGRASSVEWAVAITAGILKGLEHLHGLNMVHRDLKPSNVLLDGGTPRLTDFGLVRILRSSARNRPSDGAGTFPYTAPEMFRGAFSEQSDVWSAGVILYQMLAGTLPFPQEHNAEIMYAICNTNAPELPDSVPGRVRAIVKQALDRDLARRYPTARAMREALAPHPASDLLNKSMASVPSAESAMVLPKASSAAAQPAQSQYDLTPISSKKAPPPKAEPAKPANDLFGMPSGVKPLEESPIATTPAVAASIPTALKPPPRRRSAVPALGGALLVIAACGVGAFVWPRAKRPAPSVQGTAPPTGTLASGPSEAPHLGTSTPPGAVPPSTSGIDPTAKTDVPPIDADPKTLTSEHNTQKSEVKPATLASGPKAGTGKPHAGVVAHSTTKVVPTHTKAAAKPAGPVKHRGDSGAEERRVRVRRQAERQAEARRNRRNSKPTPVAHTPQQHKPHPTTAPDHGDNGR